MRNGEKKIRQVVTLTREWIIQIDYTGEHPESADVERTIERVEKTVKAFWEQRFKEQGHTVAVSTEVIEEK